MWELCPTFKKILAHEYGMEKVRGMVERSGSLPIRLFEPNQISSLLIVLAVVAIALLVGGSIGVFGLYAIAAVVGGLLLLLLLILRQYEMLMAVLIFVHLYVDQYIGLHLIVPLLAFFLLIYFLLARSEKFPVVGPQPFWLWVLFLILTIYPAIQGGQYMLYDAASYYPSNIFGAFLMFWLGNIIVRSYTPMRKLFAYLALLGALLAIHTLIQAFTGIILFSSSHYDAVLNLTSDFALSGTSSLAHRTGSFFVDPNWNGTFLAMMFFLPLGLFFESKNWLKKGLYALEMALLLGALISTYSTGAWVGFLAALGVFWLLMGRVSYRLWFLFIALLGTVLIFTLFPTQLTLQWQHASGTNELSLRIAAWQTAIQVIKAFPLTGIGLGTEVYLIRANPYRVPAQFLPLAHPHDSYLEWAAMAGIPVLLIFLALLGNGLWAAWRNWRQCDRRTQALVGGGIACIVELSVNSISINGWTLFALSMLAWLILGGLASPLLQPTQPLVAIEQDDMREREVVHA